MPRFRDIHLPRVPTGPSAPSSPPSSCQFHHVNISLTSHLCFSSSPLSSSCVGYPNSCLTALFASASVLHCYYCFLKFSLYVTSLCLKMNSLPPTPPPPLPTTIPSSALLASGPGLSQAEGLPCLRRQEPGPHQTACPLPLTAGTLARGRPPGLQGTQSGSR